MTQRQKDIVNASLEIISQDGISCLTTKNIANKMNFTEGAIFKHFSNKSQILNEISKTIIDNLKKMHLNMNNHSDPVNKIKSVIDEWVDICINKEDIARIIFSKDILKSSITEVNDFNLMLQEFGKKDIQFYIKNISEAQSQGKLRNDINPQSLYYIISSPFGNLNYHYLNSDKKMDLKSESNILWNDIMKCLKPVE